MISSTFSGIALVFYFLAFWFCKSSYEEERKTEEDKPKETDAQNEELLCAESVLWSMQQLQLSKTELISFNMYIFRSQIFSYKLRLPYTDDIWKRSFISTVRPGREKAGRWNGQSALGPMCDAEKDWHERSFRASGEINGCQKFPLNEPEINFYFIFESPVV